MKKLSIIMVCLAALVFVGCSSTSSTSSSAATTSGATCGRALVSLYKNYKQYGQIDMSNGVNLSNILAVTAGYKALKNNKSEAGYRAAFTKGMISAGQGLITTENVGTIVDKICNSTGLSDVNASDIQQKAQSAMTIIEIMKMLK